MKEEGLSVTDIHSFKYCDDPNPKYILNNIQNVGRWAEFFYLNVINKNNRILTEIEITSLDNDFLMADRNIRTFSLFKTNSISIESFRWRVTECYETKSGNVD